MSKRKLKVASEYELSAAVDQMFLAPQEEFLDFVGVTRIYDSRGTERSEFPSCLLKSPKFLNQFTHWASERVLKMMQEFEKTKNTFLL